MSQSQGEDGEASEDDTEAGELSSAQKWLARGTAFLSGVVVYGLVVPLLAALIASALPMIPRTIAAYWAFHLATSWALPGVVMLALGVGISFLYWRIPLQAGGAAGFGGAAVHIWSILSLPKSTVNMTDRWVGLGVLLILAGLLGGFLARRLVRDKRTEARRDPDG